MIRDADVRAGFSGLESQKSETHLDYFPGLTSPPPKGESPP
jgi:hypothetical protein